MSDSNSSFEELVNGTESLGDAAKILEAVTANGITATRNGTSPEVANRAATLMLLAELGNRKARQEDGLTYQGTQFIIPEQYQGKPNDAAQFIVDHAKNQAARIDMVRQFKYRPFDVANAAHQVMISIFGYGGTGIDTPGMFGPTPPAMIDVAIGVGQKVQVPYHRVDFSPMDGHLDIGHTRSPNGMVGEVTVNAPRYMRQVVDGFFEAMEEELHERSIYRGKAISQGESGEIEFLDLSTVRREDVVYGDEVMNHLEASIWVVIRNMELLREMGQPIKRAVLLEGPYGTGKTLAGFLTALECVANGVTFIFAKPGSDLNQAMQTAQLYAPAVVFFEDIDTLQSNDPEAVSKLLDTFDGIGGKGKEVMAILTTNNRDDIHKGMLRPGRLDDLIHIAELDKAGVQRLFEVSTRQQGLVDLKLQDIDWDAVYEACEGYLPAFVREAAARSIRYTMVRVGGKPTVLTTEDLVNAANGLRSQFELMTGADEIRPTPELNTAMEDTIKNVLGRLQGLDSDGDRSAYAHSFTVADH